MTSTNHQELPQLRAVDPQLVLHEGRRMLVLRDPLQISDKMIGIPVELAPILALCDGTRDSSGLQASLIVRYGLRVTMEIIERFLEACDEALLLDNERFRQAQAGLLAKYRAAPFRPPALAGVSYPADAESLAALFVGYEDARGRALGPETRGEPPRDPAAHRADTWPASNGRGSIAAIISPHIDYQRGGPVYGAVWGQARELARGADIAIVFGTDHYGGPGELTLTRQSYATPFGVLPTPEPIVDALARAIGPERAFASELHHRSEHAIELALTWLHYVRRDLPPLPVVPILCGSFHHFVAGQAHPERDPAIGALVHTLLELTAGQRVLVVAGADLAHVGPAFGGPPQGPAECGRLRLADREIMERTCACDAPGFFEAVREVGDRYNVCGLPPIYLTLRTLAGSRVLGGHEDAGGDGLWAFRGRQVAYDTCPADEASFVSICGLILER